MEPTRYHVATAQYEPPPAAEGPYYRKKKSNIKLSGTAVSRTSRTWSTGCRIASPEFGSIELNRKMVCPWFVEGTGGTVHVVVNDEIGELPELSHDA